MPVAVISFENALKLAELGCDIPAEQAYHYYTDSFREERQEGIKKVVTTWEEWDKNLKSVTLNAIELQRSKLSNRFYDSWNDGLAYAYSTFELARILELCSPLMIMATMPPDEVVEHLFGLDFKELKIKWDVKYAHI